MSILDATIGANKVTAGITQDTNENEIFEVDLKALARHLSGEPVYVTTILGGDGTVTGTGRVRIYGSDVADQADITLYDSGALTLVQNGVVSHRAKINQVGDGAIRYIRGTFLRSTAVGNVSRLDVNMGPEGGQTAYV